MANKVIDALVFCPFYICESKKSITCEGIIGSRSVTQFMSEKAKKDHEYSFCCSKACKGCLMHLALMNNYEIPTSCSQALRH